MVRLRLALGCVLGVLLLTPQVATAGGWWSSISVNRSYVAPGQHVEVEAVPIGKAAQGSDRFYVYLLRGFDDSVVERAMTKGSPRNWWSLGDAKAIRVGQLGANISDARFGRETAAFTMPQLPPATYHLMLCDKGCVEPLANVVPATGLTVVADPAAGQLAQRVERLERKTRQQARDRAAQLDAARTDAYRALDAAQNARSQAKQLEAGVSSLADEDRRPPWAAYAGWLVAGALPGALALLYLRRRRSRSRRPPNVSRWHPSDEELRELLSSEPTSPR